jgi:hypothetical protein
VRRIAPVLSALLLPLLLGLTACGEATERAAATVDGVDISDDSLRDDLKAIDRDDAYRELLEQSYGAPLRGDAPGSWNKSFVARLLTLRIFYELIEQKLEDEDVTVGKADLEEAESLVKAQLEQVGAADAFETFTTSYRRRMVRQQALIAVAQRYLLGDPEAFFRDNPALFQLACVSHILVSTDGTTEDQAKAEADGLARQLAGGASFAQLAQSNSDDRSGSGGGELGCELPSRYVAEFKAAVEGAPVGQVTAPVKTQFGWHLILVTARRAATYAEVEDQVADVQAAQTGASIDQFLGELTCAEGTRIRVLARYGTWDRTGCEEGGVGVAFVTPPGGGDEEG